MTDRRAFAVRQDTVRDDDSSAEFVIILYPQRSEEVRILPATEGILLLDPKTPRKANDGGFRTTAKMWSFRDERGAQSLAPNMTSTAAACRPVERRSASAGE